MAVFSAPANCFVFYVISIMLNQLWMHFKEVFWTGSTGIGS